MLSQLEGSSKKAFLKMSNPDPDESGHLCVELDPDESGHLCVELDPDESGHLCVELDPDSWLKRFEF